MSKIDLYNGDCLEVMDNLIKDGVKVDAIITDPPYDIPTISGGGTINTFNKLNESLKDLKRVDITKSYDIERFAKLAEKIMAEGINIYFWCNKKQIPNYFNTYVNNMGCNFQILCWHKTNALPSYSNKYLSDTEYLLYFFKGKGKCHPEGYEDAKTFYFAPINLKDKNKYGHPTIKPLDITEKIIRNSSKSGQVILDPFMGSGTTGVACQNLNRDFIGIELDKEYFEIAKKRMEVEQQCINWTD